jgi:hypothetical protein
MHWDGAAWTVVPTPLENATFAAVKAFSSTNVCAVGTAIEGSRNQPLSARWDGAQWSLIPTPPVTDNSGFLRAISGRDQSVWAVGEQGLGSHDLLLTWTRQKE